MRDDVYQAVWGDGSQSDVMFDVQGAIDECVADGDESGSVRTYPGGLLVWSMADGWERAEG